jgi:SAM-dependent methyltransferase
MQWESRLLGETRLGKYRQCMRLIQAYTALAPHWERLCLFTYCGLGTLVASCLGVDTERIWTAGEIVVLEMLAASGLSHDEIARHLRAYVRFRAATSGPLASEEAYQQVYKQEFYPLVQHLNFALQPSAAARLKFVMRVAATCQKPQATVLDVGCGSGTMLCRILKDHPRWRANGLDISPAAIRYSRRLAEHCGVERLAQFQVADAACLPLQSQSADMVIASEVLEHVPELESALREMARVLVPGGQAALTVPLESRTPLHLETLAGEDRFLRLAEHAGLLVADYEIRRERVGYGDDRGHLFVLAEKRTALPFAHPQLPAAERAVPGMTAANPMREASTGS